MQNAMLAAQAEYNGRPKLLAQASGLAIFGQFLGGKSHFHQGSNLRHSTKPPCTGTIGLAIAEAIFSSQLSKNLAIYAPTAPYELVARSPLNIYSQLDPSLVADVVVAYVKALDTVYIICVPAAGLSLFIAFGIKNLSTRQVSRAGATGQKAGKEAKAAPAGDVEAGNAAPVDEKRPVSEGQESAPADATDKA